MQHFPGSTRPQRFPFPVFTNFVEGRYLDIGLTAPNLGSASLEGPNADPSQTESGAPDPGPPLGWVFALSSGSQLYDVSPHVRLSQGCSLAITGFSSFWADDVQLGYAYTQLFDLRPLLIRCAG